MLRDWGYLRAVDHARRDGEPQGSAAEDAALAFTAFVLLHADCDGASFESRLDDDHLAAWCRGCGEARTFGPAGDE